MLTSYLTRPRWQSREIHVITHKMVDFIWMSPGYFVVVSALGSIQGHHTAFSCPVFFISPGLSQCLSVSLKFVTLKALKSTSQYSLEGPLLWVCLMSSRDWTGIWGLGKECDGGEVSLSLYHIRIYTLYSSTTHRWYCPRSFGEQWCLQAFATVELL